MAGLKIETDFRVLAPLIPCGRRSGFALEDWCRWKKKSRWERVGRSVGRYSLVMLVGWRWKHFQRLIYDSDICIKALINGSNQRERERSFECVRTFDASVTYVTNEDDDGRPKKRPKKAEESKKKLHAIHFAFRTRSSTSWTLASPSPKWPSTVERNAVNAGAIGRRCKRAPAATSPSVDPASYWAFKRPLSGNNFRWGASLARQESCDSSNFRLA